MMSASFGGGNNRDQLQQQTDEQREEEYLSAKRAAVEAIQVGRTTLEQSELQQEQLERAEALADETQYKLDKAGRILRGMTWSGWVANMFSKDSGPPPETTVAQVNAKRRDPPDVYEDNMPTACRPTAQAAQNYHANVKVLEACETNEQRDTCQTICESMYTEAVDQLNLLQANSNLDAYALQFAADIACLRNRQKISQARDRDLLKAQIGNPRVSTKEQSAKEQSPLDRRRAEQDEHLDFISQSLGELGNIATSINFSVNTTSETVERLDHKSESILEKSRMNTRRADRIIQKRSWTPTKPTFHAHVAIRHIDTGKYLSIINNDLYLVPKLHHETGVFALWKRQGDIFGLKNKFKDRWVGQNLFGSLACSSSTFGRREEWEADSDDWSKTRLVCTSAGWGAGGYIHVKPTDHSVSIGGSDIESKNKAALWAIVEQAD